MVEQSNTGSKIVVAESGNKRKTISAEDVQQCIKDISGWFQTNAAAYYSSKLEGCQGANTDEIANLLKEFNATGSHLGVALQKYNGALQYEDTFVGLTLAEISELDGKLGLKAKSTIPFAKDIDGNPLCIQVANGKESVVTVDCDTSEVMEDHKLTYAEYIEQIREKLLTGKLVYEEGLGLVSVA